MKYTALVDVFHGNGSIDLPQPEGIAATWHFIKALCGNTHPGAMLPFGKYSVCPYSGGYSSGYGVNKCNTGGPIEPLMPALRLRGFSHFQNSGTGAIGVYYNYAVVKPYYGDLPAEDFGVVDEHASPGYYAVTLAENGIACELTTCPCAALHRYTFDQEGGSISIDFTNDGLYDQPHLRGQAVDPIVTRVNDKELYAQVTLQGVRFYFVAQFKGCGALDENGIYKLHTAGQVELAITANTTSMDAARTEADHALSFDTARQNATDSWETALSRIAIDCEDETEAKLFYSNFYHSLVKPCDWGSGGFLWEGAPFVVDFATLWDMYKTEMPLIFTLYPDLSRHIVATYAKLGELYGKLPHCFMLTSNTNIENKQARINAEHMLYDAWIRGVEADWPKLCQWMIADIQRADYHDFLETGCCPRTTHTLDMAEGCAAVAEIAEACSLHAEAAKLRELAKNWRNAFDPKTGMLYAACEYYEGNHHNYSFRPLREMEERIALCTPKRFEEALDRFFGFTHANDISSRFEGFNNETDMEAPYAYCYIGRQDKLCQILDGADRYMFRTAAGGVGRGGIPGNNDSGGLSSCYLWNTLGIFPVSGQNWMWIAKPKFRRTVIHLANGRDFTIRREGNNAYPTSAILNGKPCEKLRFPASSMMEGGELSVHL